MDDRTEMDMEEQKSRNFEEQEDSDDVDEEIPVRMKRKKKRNRLKGGSMGKLKTLMQDVFVAILIAILLYQLMTPTIVKEHSMENTLNNNDYLLLWKMDARMGKTPAYGDIVVFRSNLMGENGKDKLLIKRVVGLPGDTVAVRDGTVYRNGNPLEEPYTKDGFTTGGMDESIVPPGTLFVLGDNRAVSIDSRSEMVGFVDEGRLIGKAVFRLFPFDKIGGLYDNYQSTPR
ncbi:MAG: signal peptidase I [Anaerovoracaceae bacterium]